MFWTLGAVLAAGFLVGAACAGLVDFEFGFFFLCHAAQNGPMLNSMLTIAATPISSKIIAVINVSDGGNLLSP